MADDRQLLFLDHQIRLTYALEGQQARRGRDIEAFQQTGATQACRFTGHEITSLSSMGGMASTRIRCSMSPPGMTSRRVSSTG